MLPIRFCRTITVCSLSCILYRVDVAEMRVLPLLSYFNIQHFTFDRYCYYVLSTGALQWQRGQGTTESRSTGPAVDHTTGTSTGYYAFIDASTAVTGDVARLISSPQTPGKGVNVLTFAHKHRAVLKDDKVRVQKKKM